MTSLFTCHQELVVWDGNLVKPASGSNLGSSEVRIPAKFTTVVQMDDSLAIRESYMQLQNMIIGEYRPAQMSKSNNRILPNKVCV